MKKILIKSAMLPMALLAFMPAHAATAVDLASTTSINISVISGSVFANANY